MSEINNNTENKSDDVNAEVDGYDKQNELVNQYKQKVEALNDKKREFAELKSKLGSSGRDTKIIAGLFAAFVMFVFFGVFFGLPSGSSKSSKSTVETRSSSSSQPSYSSQLSRSECLSNCRSGLDFCSEKKTAKEKKSCLDSNEIKEKSCYAGCPVR